MTHLRFVAALLVVAVIAPPALAQSDERRDRFVAFVERVTENAKALEARARGVADDIAKSDEFARAEREVNEIGAGVAALADTLGDKANIEKLTTDMRAWVEENRERIDELDSLSRRNRAELRALWQRQDDLVKAIGQRLEAVRNLTEEDFALLAEEKAVRMEMARVGIERTSRQAQALAAREIANLARELAQVRKQIEDSLAKLSPAS
jgi:hypothetical protein